MKIISSKTKYQEIVAPKLKEAFGYKNKLSIPVIKKVVVNIGIGKLGKEKEKINDMVETMRVITGQNPLMTKAKKSISGFKVREGAEVGIKVTLRGPRMWDFIDRLNNVVYPRTRDFQGVKASSVSKEGDLNLGIKEHIVFPEISAEDAKFIFGLQVNVATNAKTQAEGDMLFRLLGFPLQEKK
ncbi:MAG: 50S ribosomal protein L5 [Candidatus Moraniibacteriota bacterium]